MNRREMLRNVLAIGSGTASALLLPFSVKAFRIDDPTPGPLPSPILAGELQPRVVIERNHGHQLTLTLSGVVRLLQGSQQGNISLDIQGSSGHNHSVELQSTQLMELLSLGQLSVLSSQDFGHSHPLQLTLVET